MKKNALVMSAVILSLALIGCGTSTTNSDTTQAAATEEKSEPLDLSGKWIQKDRNPDNYMAATVQDGKIGVFFVLKDDDTPYTYWVGTYDVPTEATDAYSWVSKTTYAGHGMLASNADEKEFTYKSGELSYEVTIQGETNTVRLERGDWDTSNLPESAFGSVRADQADITSLEIADSGWYVEGKYLKYYVDLYNPSESTVVEFPGYTITARDADGGILGNSEQVLSVIYPGQHFIYGGQGFSVDEQPASVEFKPKDLENHNLKNASIAGDYVPLEVVNTAVRSDKLVGEVNNPGQETYDMVIVSAICKDENGQPVFIQSTFINNVKPGESVPFEISHFKKLDENANVDYYAYQW